MSEETALQIQKNELTEAPVTPQDIASKVKTYMEAKPKKIEFNGVRYPEYDDYQYAASFLGWRVVTESEPVTINEIAGFKGKAKIVDRSGIEVGQADSYCFSNERNWSTKPLFQLGSMAQTRAGAKALANILRPIFKLAGYETTPSEEMSEQRTVQTPKTRPISTQSVKADSPYDEGENNTEPVEFEEPKAVKGFGDQTLPVTEKQQKMLYAIYKQAGISDETMKINIKAFYGLDHSRDLTRKQFNELLELIKKGAIR